MLTPVWFILVAIAIPCQAYLDDRVLLDQHWTGFSPTAEDVRRRENFKALQRGRHHAPQLSDNEPDKWSAGFSVRSTGTDPQMVPGTSRSSTERAGDAYLRLRRYNARSFETAERSILRVLYRLERLRRQERLGSARVDVTSTQRAIRTESRRSDSRRQERESRDRRLEGNHDGVYAGSERHRTADIPTWVKENSRRKVRSDIRDVVGSGDRLTPIQTRRADDRSDIRERKAGRPATSQSQNDLHTSSSERLSRFDKTSENGQRIGARADARPLERRIESNRLSKMDAARSAFSGGQVDGKADRYRYLRDAVEQSRIIMEHLNNLIVLAKKLSIRPRVVTGRSAKNTGRHHQTREQGSNRALELEAVTRGNRLSRTSFHKGDNAKTSSGTALDDRAQTIGMSNVRNGNVEDNKDVRRDVRHSERVESRTRDIRTSLQSSRNREARRAATDKRYVTDAVDSRRIGTTRSVIGRTLANVLDERHADTEDRYLTRLSRTQYREDKESGRERQQERASGTRDTRNDQWNNSGVQDRGSLSSSVRHDDARIISMMRGRVDASHRQHAKETSIQVYDANQHARTGDAALSQTAENRHRLSRLVDSRARTAGPNARHLVREQGFIARDRVLGDAAQRYLFLASQLAESRRERCGEARYQHFHSADFHDKMVADSRMSSDRRQLSYGERENALSVRTDLPYGESRTSRASRDGAMLDTVRSTRGNEDAADRTAYRRSPQDMKSSRVRTEWDPLERRQSDGTDFEDTASNDRRDMPITQLFKTDLSLSRDAFRKAPSAEDMDEKQAETSRYAKHQKSPLFWDEFTPSHFRSDSSLFRTVLTVGMVAWMAMSPPRKIMD